ncbi:MAG: YebC/PmpR family DNA-binding transcriptional regulator [bacterium]
MSGHSKWSSIKHKKAKTDSQRGKLFTKIIRELTVAARSGGGDPNSNSRLRTAMQAAKEANMPGDTLKKAIQRGTGELPGVTYEEMNYEGYGPAGVAILLDVVTDNKNRTAAEIRNLFTRYNGNMGEIGCVCWMFQKKGLIAVDKKKAAEDQLMEIILDAGAEDIVDIGAGFEITTKPENLHIVKDSLLKKGIEPDSAQISMIPNNTITVENKEAEKVLKLIEALEEHDDVQNVYANFDIDESVVEKITG